MAARLIGIVAKTSACSASLCQATCPAKQPRKPGDFGAGKNPALPYPFVAPVHRRATDKGPGAGAAPGIMPGRIRRW